MAIYGRRVGKTELVNKFIYSHDNDQIFYYQCFSYNNQYYLKEFIHIILEKTEADHSPDQKTLRFETDQSIENRRFQDMDARLSFTLIIKRNNIITYL